MSMICRYRMLSRPYAFGCVLRLRTSSEFKTGHSVSVMFFAVRVTATIVPFSFLVCYCTIFLLFIIIILFIYFFIYFCSMVISFQIHSMRTFNTLFVVILTPHMLMTLSLMVPRNLQSKYVAQIAIMISSFWLKQDDA